jgi:hypothetical protein
VQLESGANERAISPRGALGLMQIMPKTSAFLPPTTRGPERYEQHLSTGRPLPAETQAYLAALAPVTHPERRYDGSSAASRVVPWRQAPLFVEQLESVPVHGRSASALHFKSSSEVPFTASPPALAPRAEGLFMRRPNEMQSRRSKSHFVTGYGKFWPIEK